MNDEDESVSATGSFDDDRWECSLCMESVAGPSRHLHATKIHEVSNWFDYPWIYLGRNELFRCDVADCHGMFFSLRGLNMHMSKAHGIFSGRRRRKNSAKLSAVYEISPFLYVVDWSDPIGPVIRRTVDPSTGVTIYDARQLIIAVADEALEHWSRVRRQAAKMSLGVIDAGSSSEDLVHGIPIGEENATGREIQRGA